VNLSAPMQKRLVDEVNFVIERMRGTDSPSEKLYFFSAVYAVVQRIMNFEYDPELTFIHQVVNTAYNMVNARVTASGPPGQEMPVQIPDRVFGGLEEALADMVALIQRGDHTYPALQKIANLAYSTTGNGYYLYRKGMLSV